LFITHSPDFLPPLYAQWSHSQKWANVILKSKSCFREFHRRKPSPLTTNIHTTNGHKPVKLSNAQIEVMIMSEKKAVWMHIGAGSFHRAHQAWYLHKLMEQGDDRWSIALGNIRDDASVLLGHLAAQNGEYVLETVSPEGERQYETITSIRKVLPWDSEISALVKQGADAETRVIAFTVTESGYYLTPEHELDQQQADIQADLNGGIRTLYGALTRILKQRIAQHGDPVTLLNCDNLRHNGERFRHGFLSFLQAKGESELRQWVEKTPRHPIPWSTALPRARRRMWPSAYWRQPALKMRCR
jgi:mannitol-1-phosphate/altronate dehydrogenase